MREPAPPLVQGRFRSGRLMSELKRRLFKVVGDPGQSEAARARVEPIEEVREGIAQLLKQTRERYGQSLRDVSANLRIRLAYLQAIENGRFRELPGPTYAVGFVRSYAEYLDPTDGPGWLSALQDYAEEGSSRREAAMARMQTRRPHTWADHIRAVEDLLITHKTGPTYT